MLGRFLELSVPAPDVIESLGFYKSLGFRELETGDVRAYRYAVVSDGTITIGLHDVDMDGPEVTFVQTDIARQARSMADSGFEFDRLCIDDDVFNELAFHCRDGHTVAMVEARTFQRPDEDTENSLCGDLIELTLPVRDATRAGRFWAPLAPEVARLREEPTVHMRFNAGGLSLGLSESIALTGPSLAFTCSDTESVWIALAKNGSAHKEFPGFEGAFMEITAPEGTSLYLFDGDFLGDLYEVEESGSP